MMVIRGLQANVVVLSGRLNHISRNAINETARSLNFETDYYWLYNFKRTGPPSAVIGILCTSSLWALIFPTNRKQRARAADRTPVIAFPISRREF